MSQTQTLAAEDTAQRAVFDAMFKSASPPDDPKSDEEEERDQVRVYQNVGFALLIDLCIALAR